MSVFLGVPTITLNDGGVATYMSGSGTDTLVFSTTVAQGQAAADLAVTAFNLNGAAVADRVGRPADLSAAVANPAGAIVVSTTPVTVTAITATPSAAGSLGTGQTVIFTVTPGQPVTVTGSPTLTLNDDGTANYDAAASTPTSLVFRTTVTAGQYSPNLTVTALALNGATIAVPGGLSFGSATGTATVSADFAPSTPALAVDLNGDGIPDSIVTNPGSNTVTVRLFDAANNRFGTAIDYAVGQNPQSVTLADVNLDGKPDLLVSNHDAGTVSVLLGTGGGQFAAATTVPVNGGLSNPRSVTPADTNGDGKPDLLVATGTAVALLVGDGTGGFSAGGIGAPPTGAMVADVNGDGKPDAIVTNAYVNTVSVLLGTGNGGFGPAAAYAVGALPKAVTVADVNGDGRPDLIVANSGAGTLSVLLGTGTGGFAAATTIPVNGTNSIPSSVTVADVNNDGNPDLLVAAGTSVALLLGDGAGGFSAAGTYATGFGTDAVTMADVNGDGQLDLVAAYSGDSVSIAGGVSVLLGDKNGGFGAATSYAAGSDPSAVTTADVNGDGTPDLIVANALSGDVSVLLGNGFGGFRTAVNYAAGVTPSAVVAADVNGDGKLDLAVADGFHQVDVVLGDGTGGFGPATTELAGSAQLLSVSATDMNGDGRPDLIAASSGGSVFVLLNGSVAPGSFTSAGAATAPGTSTGLVVDTAAPPSITGTASGQGVADDGTVRPFGSVQVLDSRPSPTETVVITVSAGGVASDANGILAGAGLTRTGAGTYALAAGNPATVTASLRTLVFTPTANQVTPGASVLTGFSLSVSNGGQAAIDTSTSVSAVSVNNSPTVGGTLANQAISDTIPINLFSTVTVGDADVGQTETATVTFTAPNGIVSNSIGTTGPGHYAVSGTAGQVQAALRSLTFTPTAGQGAPGQTVATGFNLAIDDGFASTFDLATSVAVTSLACYVAGTLILTDRGGATSVENLAVGDLVCILPGDLAAVKWIGHREVDCRRHPKPEKVWPVRVAADAFGENLPRRDLLLSPDHAVFVDGVLIPVKHLINGCTIVQEPLHEVTYYHVELEHHSVILAEGLPCESYLDTGDRLKFVDGDGVVALYPDFSSHPRDIATIWEAKGCAPLVVTGTALNSVRTRLLQHARKLAVEARRWNSPNRDSRGA